jgi:moderate conductance mechanosensitive channel
MMSSPLTPWLPFTIANALHLAAICILGLLLTWLLRAATKALVKPAATPTRAAQAHEQQTRTLVDTLYKSGSGLVWLVALLTALPEFGISVIPAVAFAAAIIVGLGFGAQNFVRDMIAGFHIVFEDQFLVGDTIQTQGMIGRVEQLTLRRTVLRDLGGALVTLANGDIRVVGNLSRDWSQSFVDITLSVSEPLERTLQALETAAAGLRSDSAWAPALVDGPRVLGVQSYGLSGSTLRLQVRTQPLRQEEVSRELRRRIQVEFQRQGILYSAVRELEQASLFQALEESSREPGS